MRPQGSAKELERRRLRAVRLLEGGHGPTEVARRVGADRRTIQRWARRYETGGLDALKSKPHPGRTPALSASQREELEEELLRGPLAHGFPTELWTCPRIAVVIRRRFAVRHDPSHVSRIMRSMGWSVQKPRRRAIERDEEGIKSWVKKDWRRIKRGRAGARRT